jgi:DNA-binding NarL/FixJ family response regulator
MRSKGSITIAGTLKNCYRCGTEFCADAPARICESCRNAREFAKSFQKPLTLRETQIVDLVKRGKLNKEIAHQLHLSEGTIKEYLNKIFRKVEVKNRTELAVWALTRSRQCASDDSDAESRYWRDSLTLQ